MTDKTPLQRLDDAIETFLHETSHLTDGGFVTGWALAVSTARIQAEDESLLPMATGATYTLGPQTSIIQFAGLAKYLEIVAEKATWQQLSDPDD